MLPAPHQVQAEHAQSLPAAPTGGRTSNSLRAWIRTFAESEFSRIANAGRSACRSAAGASVMDAARVVRQERQILGARWTLITCYQKVKESRKGSCAKRHPTSRTKSGRMS